MSSTRKEYLSLKQCMLKRHLLIVWYVHLFTQTACWHAERLGRVVWAGTFNSQRAFGVQFVTLGSHHKLPFYYWEVEKGGSREGQQGPRCCMEVAALLHPALGTWGKASQLSLAEARCPWGSYTSFWGLRAFDIDMRRVPQKQVEHSFLCIKKKKKDLL